MESAVPFLLRLLKSADVLCLSETWLSYAEETTLPRLLSEVDVFCTQSFVMQVPPGFGDGRRHGGVALVCRRRAAFSFVPIDCSSPRLCAVVIQDSVGPKLGVVATYLPYWSSDGLNLQLYQTTLQQLDAVLTALRSTVPVVVAGDLNCALPRLTSDLRIPDWERLRGFSPLSRLTQTLLEDHDLIVAEYLFDQQVRYTYARGGNHTHIDHIVVPRSLVQSVRKCSILAPEVENLSPHLPILCRLSIDFHAERDAESRPSSADSTRRFVLDWRSPSRNEAYRNALASRLSTVLPTCLTPDELDKAITDAAHDAAMSSGCLRRMHPPKPWWSPSIARARDRARFWHHLWKSSGLSHQSTVYACYQEARRSYRRARIVAARSVPDNEARLLSMLRKGGQLRPFWARVERARRSGLRTCSKRSASDFALHFGTPVEDTRITPTHLSILNSVSARASQLSSTALPDRSVTTSMVNKLLTRLKRGKAPGPDGITAEHLLYGLSPALLEALSRLLTLCLSDGSVPSSFLSSTVVPLLKHSGLDHEVLENYRPISLTTTTSKLLEMVLLDELRISFKPHALQFGFETNRSTQHASLLASETVQWHLRRGAPVFAANLDARQCFPSIWHAGLFSQLQEYISPGSWLLLWRWYRQMKSQVVFRGQSSEVFSVKCGTRQGAILSPSLANVFFRPLLQRLDDSGLGAYLHGCHVPGVCYADDLLLLSTNQCHLQSLLRIVEDFAKMWRLSFVHPDPLRTKSHCLIFGARLLATTPEWNFVDQRLSICDTSEHLGIALDPQLRGQSHVDTLIRCVH